MLAIVKLFDDVELVYSNGRWTSANAAWAKLFNDKTKTISEELFGYHPNAARVIIDQLLDEMPYAKLVYEKELPQEEYSDDRLY